jgi:hypothetical protein
MIVARRTPTTMPFQKQLKEKTKVKKAKAKAQPKVPIITGDEYWDTLHPRYLDYNSCTGHEIRDFIDQRRIITTRDSKKNLIKVLERHDEQPAFKRLFDLPPELRLHIYGHYFAQFGSHMPARFKESPLIRASRVLRQEARPLFYATCRFFLETYDHRAVKTFSRNGNFEGLQYTKASELFFENAVSTTLPLVRRLTILLEWCETRRLRGMPTLI